MAEIVRKVPRATFRGISEPLWSLQVPFATSRGGFEVVLVALMSAHVVSKGGPEQVYIGVNCMSPKKGEEA